MDWVCRPRLNGCGGGARYHTHREVGVHMEIETEIEGDREIETRKVGGINISK